MESSDQSMVGEDWSRDFLKHSSHFTPGPRTFLQAFGGGDTFTPETDILLLEEAVGFTMDVQSKVSATLENSIRAHRELHMRLHIPNSRNSSDSDTLHDFMLSVITLCWAVKPFAKRVESTQTESVLRTSGSDHQ